MPPEECSDTTSKQLNLTQCVQGNCQEKAPPAATCLGVLECPKGLSISVFAHYRFALSKNDPWGHSKDRRA